MSLHFAVDLGDQRTGRIDVEQSAAFGFRPNGFGNSMGRKDDGSTIRDRVEFVDEDSALCGELVDNVGIMDDLMSHEDRRAKLR